MTRLLTFTAIVALAVSTSASAAVVHLDLSTIFNGDKITNYTGGSVDYHQNLGRDESLITVSAANFLNGSDAGVNLPDNGLISDPGIGFDVQLGYSNDDNGNNVVDLTSGSPSFTYNLTAGEQGMYSSLYLFGAGLNENSPVNFKLTYSDTSTDSDSFTALDWFADNASYGYLIDGMDRIAGGFQNANDPAVFYWSLNPDSAKTLTKIEITGDIGIYSEFPVLGISGEATLVPEPASLGLLMLGGLMIAPRRRR